MPVSQSIMYEATIGHFIHRLQMHRGPQRAAPLAETMYESQQGRTGNHRQHVLRLDTRPFAQEERQGDRGRVVAAESCDDGVAEG